MATSTPTTVPWRELVMSDQVIELEGNFIDGMLDLWIEHVRGSQEEWLAFVDWITDVTARTAREEQAQQ